MVSAAFSTGGICEAICVNSQVALVRQRVQARARPAIYDTPTDVRVVLILDLGCLFVPFFRAERENALYSAEYTELHGWPLL